MTTRQLKLLIPVDAVNSVRGATQYAARRKADGLDVHATLLHVAAPVYGGEILWFRTREDIAQFRARAGRALLEQAAAPLREAGVEVRLEQREGDVTFAVADAAEQLGCDEIVLPRQYPRWVSLLAGDPFAELWHRQSGTPMVAVDEYGSPLRRKPAIVRATVSPGTVHAPSRRPDHPPAPG